MANTTNFGWETPDDTDLVKDGASAMRTLGNAIDTSLVDLKGGTTGQVLSKASNSDMDFTWSSVDPLTILDAKGDLISATAADTPARLASSGVNGDVLQVDTSTATGLKWAAPSSGSMTLISTTTLSGATTTLSSIPQTYENLYLIVSGMTANTGNNDFRLMPNNVTNLANYTGTVDSTVTGTADQRINLTIFQNTLRTNADNLWVINFYNYTSTAKFKAFDTTGFFVNSSTQNKVVEWGGVFRSTSAISSLVFDYGGTNTFAGGTVLLYGVK